MQGQRGQDFETAARGRHSFRFLEPRPNDRLTHPVKEAAYRAAIHLNPQRGVERLAHFLQAALGIALMRAPQERLRLGGEFATISQTPPVQETGEALGRQAGLVTKILWPTKGHRVSAEKLVHGQIGSSDLFYHRCDLLGSAFPAGRGPVHPPQHSLNMAIWPACSAVFVRSWGIKRYNWTMLFRGEDSSSSWLLIISSTDSFLRARESRSYVELRSGPVSANCNSPKYQTIVMYLSLLIQSVFWGITLLVAPEKSHWRSFFHSYGFWSVLTVGIFQAVFPEEFIRMLLQTRLEKVLRYPGLGFSAASFLWASLHVPMLWSQNPQWTFWRAVCAPWTIIPIGLLWGYITHRTKSLLPAILLHGFNLWGLQNL